MALDKAALKKLSPEERIKKLKKLEESRKKDQKESEDLVQRAEAELKQPRFENVEIPKIEPVDISKIFEPEHNIEDKVKGAEADEAESSKYESAGEYVGRPLHGTRSEERRVKEDDMVKYDGNKDESTASRTVLKSIQKYSKG